MGVGGGGSDRTLPDTKKGTEKVSLGTGGPKQEACDQANGLFHPGPSGPFSPKNLGARLGRDRPIAQGGGGGPEESDSPKVSRQGRAQPGMNLSSLRTVPPHSRRVRPVPARRVMTWRGHRFRGRSNPQGERRQGPQRPIGPSSDPAPATRVCGLGQVSVH